MVRHSIEGWGRLLVADKVLALNATYVGSIPEHIVSLSYIGSDLSVQKQESALNITRCGPKPKTKPTLLLGILLMGVM